MKLFVPVIGIVVATGACCCCGGDPDEWQEQLEQLGNGEAGTEAVEGEPAEEPTDDAPAEAAAPMGNQDGLCGRFKDTGLSVPSGLSVLACNVSGTTESVVMTGSGAPKDVCAPIKGWATGAGWSVTTEASFGGTESILLKNAGEQLTVACTDATGSTTVSVSIGPGY